MSATPLNAVKVERHGDRLSFERRNAKRRTVSGRVTAVASAGVESGPLNRITPLQLLNMSDTGIGAVAQDETTVGTRITVFFPPHGAERGFDASGTVVRCRAYEHGYELGIRLSARAAA